MKTYRSERGLNDWIKAFQDVYVKYLLELGIKYVVDPIGGGNFGYITFKGEDQ